MMTNSCPYGFRIVGGCDEARRLVDATAALSGYAACDERAQVEREAYLSAFQFAADLRGRVDEYGHVDVRAFDGVCWSPWLWFDIDREGELAQAAIDAGRLAGSLVERYRLDERDLLVFFSGAKGFHVGLPTALWSPEPSAAFNRIARRMAERLAETAHVAIDTGVYDKVRPFRAPNSRHAKTGLYKRRLSLDEVTLLSVDAVVKLAAEPEPFDLPTPRAAWHDGNDAGAIAAKADWQAAGLAVEQGDAAQAQRHAANGGVTLNRVTLEIIRDGTTLGTPARNGDRHRLLYSAARNLAECGAPAALVFDLLTESGLDSGLTPSDVRRQIQCGIDDAVRSLDALRPSTVLSANAGGCER